MKTSKKIISIIIAILLTFGVALSFAPSASASEKPYDGKIVILHSNDVHGAIDGYPVMKALADDYKAKGADVLLVDAGDFSQGNAYTAYSSGKDEVLLMKMVGYDVATIGNHEFDYGINYVQELMADLQTDEPGVGDGVSVISCNILKDAVQLYDSSKTFDIDGVKIGLIGIETPEAISKSNPSINKGLDVIRGEELVEKVNDEAKFLKDNGCNVVIAVTHLGVDVASKPYRSVDLWEDLANVDFMIDGHSHTEMTQGEDGQPIQSTGCNFKNIGIIEIDKTSKQITSNTLYKITEDSPKDETVATKVAVIKKAVAEEYGKVIGYSEVELNGAKAPGNRTEETNHGDFITDAFLWYLTEKNPGSIEEGVPVVALQNGGGIRAKISQGEVTKQNVLDVLPFNNTITVIYVTGEELLEALEASTFDTPNAVGGFPQVSGMKYKINIAKAYDPASETYPGSIYYPPKTIQRVTILEAGGRSFDPQQEYAIITNDFVSGGGDTYYALKASDKKFDTGLDCTQIISEYITEKLGGRISADDYANPKGRIQIVEEKENPKPVPVTADENNVLPWLIILSVSAFAAAGCGIAQKKIRIK